ncbi:MAG: hypothetical protein JXB03_03190 [Spirochaetales bacterium]|nr:hypothetical protein [Spirochaetales bacterium]
MNGIKILAIVLIVAGIAALIYGGFTYTSQTHRTEIGPLELAIKEKNTVSIPIWAGVGAIIVGAGMLFIRKKT